MLIEFSSCSGVRHEVVPPILLHRRWSDAVTGDLSAVYRFKSGALRAGDIMLCTHQTAKSSKIIRWKTRSRFSHAAICCVPPEFLEAIPKGVCRFNADKFFFRNTVDVCVLRAKTDLAPARISAAIEEALRHLGNPYWKVGAATSVRPWEFRTKRSAVFCSQLVSLAYRKAGITLLDGVIPEKTVPGALERSPQLVDVTNDVLEPIALETAQLWLVPYGEGESTSPHQEEVVKGQEVRDRVNAWLRRNGYPEQVNFHGLLNTLRDGVAAEARPYMDAVFLQALDESGYLRLVDAKFPDEHESFRLSEYLKNGLAQGAFDGPTRRRLLANYEERLTSLENAMKDQSALGEWYDNAWQFRGLETFRRLALNQLKACEVNQRMQQEVSTCIDILRA